MVCSLATSCAHFCGDCNVPIHVICGKQGGEEGFGTKVICPNCYIAKGRIRHRSGAKVSQDKQAVAMVKRSKKVLGTPQVGQTVAVPIPLYDRGKGDSKNLLGRITQVCYLYPSVCMFFSSELYKIFMLAFNSLLLHKKYMTLRFLIELSIQEYAVYRRS